MNPDDNIVEQDRKIALYIARFSKLETMTTELKVLQNTITNYLPTNENIGRVISFMFKISDIIQNQSAILTDMNNLFVQGQEDEEVEEEI